MVKFREKHNRARNIYNYVSKRGSEYNQAFREMYYNKCAYCGISTQVLTSSNFEVDHVIPKSVLNQEMDFDEERIHGIKNLVNSCRFCNKGKEDFLCDMETFEKIHPDNNYLPELFYRDEDYSIKIKDRYADNECIKKFYKKLKLDSQLRRLDYLIMEMKDFCEKYNNNGIIRDIYELLNKIENNRRMNY